MSAITHKMSISVPISNINGGEPRFEDLKAGELVTYTGEPERIYNGFSDSFKVDLMAGRQVVVCKNQDKDGLGFRGKVYVAVHVTLKGTPKPAAGHGSACICGACGRTWEILQDLPGCDCEQQEPTYPISVVRLYKDLRDAWSREIHLVGKAIQAQHAGATEDEGASEVDVDALIERAKAKIKEAYWKLAKVRLDAGIPPNGV